MSWQAVISEILNAIDWQNFYLPVIVNVVSGLLVAFLVFWLAKTKIVFVPLSKILLGIKAKMAPSLSEVVIPSNYRYGLANCPYCIVIEGTLEKIRGLKEQDEYDIFYDDGRKVEINGCDKWRRISRNEDEKQFFILAYLNSVFTDEEIMCEEYRQEERHIAAQQLIKIEKRGTLVQVAKEDWSREKNREVLNVFTNDQGTLTGKPVPEGAKGESILIRLV